jgi:outer membrane protein TolC
MHGKHEPHDAFVERLESEIGREIRRRGRERVPGGWRAWPALRVAVGVAVLVLLSMSIGAGAVAAAYRAQDNERRELLVSSLEKRAQLAKQRLDIAAEQVKSAEGRVSIGTASREEVIEARSKAAEAQAELKSIQLQLEEVRITGREPATSLAALLVSGRDFVTERLRVDASVPEAALEAARSQLTEVMRRVEVGTADPAQAVAARGRIVELEAAIQGFRGRMEIRQKFLRGEVAPAEAELRALEAEAEVRRKVLASQLEAAKIEADRVRSRFEVGVAQQVEVARARLRVQEIETDMAKTELDLALVRGALQTRRAK